MRSVPVTITNTPPREPTTAPAADGTASGHHSRRSTLPATGSSDTQPLLLLALLLVPVGAGLVLPTRRRAPL